MFLARLLALVPALATGAWALSPAQGDPAAAPAPAAPGAAAPASDLGIELTPELRAAGISELELNGPYDPVVDQFHPDGQVTPALGGRAIMHVPSEPPNLNFLIENSSVIRWIHYEVHAALLQFSPVTWEYELDTAEAYDVEDQLILKDGGGEGGEPRVIFGRLLGETDQAWLIESGSRFNPLPRTEVPKSDVASVERGTVYTFDLRDGVLWHDGHPFDADDVLFTLAMLRNPDVDCDEKRFKYDKIRSAEKLADDVVRFFWKEQYFGTTGSFDLDFCLLPSHLYNLADPDNPAFDPGASEEQQGNFVDENPHNDQWVGLGPYRVTAFERGQYVEAQKFDGYWKKRPEEAGYLDTIRWRTISNDDLAFQALLNDEVDTFDRVKSEDYFGDATRSELFNAKCYKVLNYVGNLGYLVWNTRRPKLSDVRVRQALGHAFDVRGWIATNYRGYALWSTSTMLWFGPAYNHELEPLAYDPAAAEDLLAEAGWYDRDGDGIVDQDGESLVIEALMPSGNKASETFLQKAQESYRRVGIKLEIRQLEWATFLERLLDREFDGANLAWTIVDVESDPEQIWHGKHAPGRTSNHAGLDDPEINALILAGQRELDDDQRHAIWHEVHRRIYEQQPYLFGWTVPRKVAVNRRIHGLKLYKFEPGYRMRDLYFEAGTPGTRPLGDAAR